MEEITQFKEYTTQPGDRWDSIAYREYGDCFKYKYIVMNNPQVPISPFLKPGINLKIPVLSETVQINEDLPPWKQ